jgi:hypothetical protein
MVVRGGLYVSKYNLKLQDTKLKLMDLCSGAGTSSAIILLMTLRAQQ